jgi:hypothetical protein
MEKSSQYFNERKANECLNKKEKAEETSKLIRVRLNDRGAAMKNLNGSPIAANACSNGLVRFGPIWFPITPKKEEKVS